MVLTIIGIYLASIIGPWIICNIDVRQRDWYTSGTNTTWIFLLFFPVVNTIIFSSRLLYLFYGITFGISEFINEWKREIKWNRERKEMSRILKENEKALSEDEKLHPEKYTKT